MRITKFLKKCWMPLAILMITMAILFSLFRALTPWAKQYKGQVEQHLSMMLGQPVTINDLETSWYWFQPVLKMDQVRLSDKQDHVLKLNKLLVGINLFSSLLHWQIQPGVLYVEDVNLTLRQVNNHWDVEGLNQDKQSMSIESESYLQILTWVLAQQKIVLKNVSANVYLGDGTLLPLRDLNLITKHSYGHYRVKGHARLEQSTPTALTIIADMQLDPYALKSATGHAYVSVQRILPAQWQGFFPDFAYHVNGGEGNLELWLDLVKGNFFSLQSKLDFKQIAWVKDGQPNKHTLQFLQANLALRTTSYGWQLTGDQINFSLDGRIWPANALQLDYKKTQKKYQAFVKTLSLESLLALDVPWPSSALTALDMHPRGLLHDTQIEFKKNEVDYFISQFENLGWQGRDDIPSVSGVSGVLYWQPAEGHLEFDAEKSLITPKGQAPVLFDQFNAAFDWKQLNNGLKVSMDRFVLSRPDLVLSAQGVLDDMLQPTANLRMTAEFSANDARHWIDYIPSRYLKPKLDAWLKHDIKRVGKASGRLVVNGLLVDFPFDNKQGEFSINSYVDGVDLLIGKDWPLSRDIAAHLKIDGRTLDADIVHADLKGVVVDKMSLVLNDIGLGREALLIHGDINAPAEKIKDYVFASPIGSKLLRWKMVDIRDSLDLDLRLEVPLYPESDHVFARGVLKFENNQVILHHVFNDISLDNLAGTIQFDEQGITNSELQGALAGDPVAMHIQSIRKPKPYIEVNIEASTSIDLLRKKFSFPLLGFMDGHVSIQSLLTLTDDQKDMDHMKISTSMEGVSVDLPPPLGKNSNDAAPLTIDIDFNSEKSIKAVLAYKDMRVKASKVTKDDWSVKLQNTDISADMHYLINSNTLTGSIDHLYLTNVMLLNSQMKSVNAALKPSDIPNLNITMGTLKLDKVDLGNMSLKSTSNPKKWLLDYCKIQSPDYLLTIQGDWTRDGKQNNTRLQADLQLSDLGKALARWNIIPAVEAHRGNVLFKGGWPGAPHDFSLNKVSGDVQISLKSGRITNLDKATEEKLGLGKLLSVLSLQTIPRRLKLDFSDLSKGGYSFDEFKGSFVLKNGVMSTQDSYIDGPVAYASMKGDLDLVKHLYDVDLRVSPYIMASLPLVVTIAGGPIAGPIAGIATWVASKLINKGMQQISAYTYKISGPWLDPVVQQVSIYRKK